jgi:hypothetical protein
MKLLSDYLIRLDQILIEQAGDLDESGKLAAIDAAAREHSRYRPYRRLHQYTGDGISFDFALGVAPGPSDWEQGYSQILSVEYPAGQREPQLLEDGDWVIYEKITGPVLRLLNDTPGAGKTIVITYTVRHQISESNSTIPDSDFEAVAHLAAAFALQSLSNRYLQNTSATISADAIDNRSKSFDAAQNAERERKIYYDHFGLQAGAAAGFATKDLDVNYPWGEDRLTHPNRWR